MKIDKSRLAKSIALPVIVGAAAGFLTRSGMKAFQTLEHPPLTPPEIVFPIVWTILYTLMGISFYIINKRNESAGTSQASAEDFANARMLYFLQLFLNFVWPFLFFNLQWHLLAFFWLLALWIVVIVMIKQFHEISKTAAYLNVPYLLWLTFAAYLNLGVWWLNR